MPNIGMPELIIVLLIVLLIFGGAKLPKLARSLGEARNEFEKSSKNDPKRLEGKAAADDGDEKITLSKAELDALLADREAKARAKQD